MTTLLDALKKLAMDGSAASVSGKQERSVRVGSTTGGITREVTDQRLNPSQSGRLEGSLSGEDSPVRPQPSEGTDKCLRDHASRPIDGAAKSKAASHTSE